MNMRFLKLLLPIFLLTILPCNVSPKAYSPATILLTNEEKLEGWVRIKYGFFVKDRKKAIYYKPTPKERKRRIKLNDAHAIVYTQEDNSISYCENLSVIKDKSYMKGNTKGKKDFYFLILPDGEATLYCNTFNYYQNGRYVGTISFYVARKRNCDYAVSIGRMETDKYDSTRKKIKLNRKVCEKFFEDYPELANQFQNKSFKVNNIEDLVNEYNNFMETKKPNEK